MPDDGTGNGAPTPSGTPNGTNPGTAPSRYDANLHYDTQARYYVQDSTLPALSPQVSKVKMELSRRTDLGLSAFVTNHISLIAGKPAFANPSPAPAALLTALTDFEQALTDQQVARDMFKAATTVKDIARKTLEDLMIARGAYVQTASGGNAMLIENVGLDVRNNPSPVGPLAPPININAELNGVAGLLKLRWKPVKDARGYLVQCSPDVMPREFTQIKNTSKASLTLENLTLGETLVFRIASQGGSTGQSPWSAEVIRGVA